MRHDFAFWIEALVFFASLNSWDVQRCDFVGVSCSTLTLQINELFIRIEASYGGRLHSSSSKRANSAIFSWRIHHIFWKSGDLLLTGIEEAKLGRCDRDLATRCWFYGSRISCCPLLLQNSVFMPCRTRRAPSGRKMRRTTKQCTSANAKQASRTSSTLG